MQKPNAAARFHGPDRYNCAQAVLAAYASLAGIGPACIDRFSRVGSGRAPEGECGALFAAKAILPDAADHERVEQAFSSAAGATRCREIRKLGRLSCRQCVEQAADEVFAAVTEGRPLRRPAGCLG